MDLNASLERFHRDGFLLLEGVLSERECDVLCAEISQAMVEYPAPWRTTWMRPQMFLRGPVFADLLDKAPAFDLAEALLSLERGDNQTLEEPLLRDGCHVLNLTACVTREGDPGSRWHIDDYLLMPRPPGVRWDERIPFPVYIISALYYLTDVDGAMGPTVVVPGSHRSGARQDPEASVLEYEGRGAVVIEARRGDCLFFHSQLWHHAAPHLCDRERVVQQVHYASRFVTPRLFPMPNHHVPADLLLRLSPRRQRLLGMHPCWGQYT